MSALEVGGPAYAVVRQIRGEPLPVVADDVVADAALSWPAGWQVNEARRYRVDVGFTDLNAPGNAQIAAKIATGDLAGNYPDAPIAASTGILCDWLWLRRGSESVIIEVFALADNLAHTWAGAIMAEANRWPPDLHSSLTPVPLGIGFIGGPVAVIQSDGRLIVITYDDGDRTSGSDPDARATSLQEGAREFMVALTSN